MPETQRLSDLLNDIDATINSRFGGRTFRIKAEITDVNKQPAKNWCFLKFIEKDGGAITAEMRGVFWSNAYHSIGAFERASGQTFTSGIEITCSVRVRFNKRFGLSLEVQEIDFAYTLGQLELERQQILAQLAAEQIAINPPGTSYYITRNNRLPLPRVFQHIALIASGNTDGQRDFKKVVQHNKYGHVYVVHDFLTQVQGDNASKLIIEQLQRIAQSPQQYDIVVIVRGGGSDTDFKCFNNYDLARCVAGFPVPILTGIGHDRNTSIVDLMARQHKTPTEVATFIIDHNWDFEHDLQQLKDRFFGRVDTLVLDAGRQLEYYRRIVKSSSPATILNRGFAIITVNGKIVTNPEDINEQTEMQTLLRDSLITSTVTKKTYHDNGTDL